MIHNLKVKLENNKFQITFDVVTEVGKCKCVVHINDITKDGQSKCFVTDYEVLGQEFTNSNQPKLFFDHSIEKEKLFSDVMMIGVKRISDIVAEICQCNNWNLWSY